MARRGLLYTLLHILSGPELLSALGSQLYCTALHSSGDYQSRLRGVFRRGCVAGPAELLHSRMYKLRSEIYLADELVGRFSMTKQAVAWQRIGEAAIAEELC